MQVEDIRVLMRLPRSGLPAGANFAAASMIFNLIAGASVCLHNTGSDSLNKRGNRGELFKGLLEEHFPWPDEAQICPTSGAKFLYEYARNPLAHSLGLDADDAPEITVAKSRIGPVKIAQLEDLETRPSWAEPALVQIGDGYQLNVHGLYWGAHRMLHAALADTGNAQGAEALARSLGY